MIQITNHLFLEPITELHQKPLMALMHKIYPPSYQHLWVNKDSEWYLERCFSIKNLSIELGEEASFYYFIIYKTKRIGILRFCYNKKVPGYTQSNAVFLHRLYLDQEFHGKGLAKEVMRWIEKQALATNTKFIWLKAMDTQMQAIRFYQKEGFETVGSECLNFNQMLKDFRGMILMCKSLKNK